MKIRSKASKAYTLVEVLVGIAILGVAIGTATTLSSTSSEIEARSREVGRANSIIEAAHNLYQLGMAPADIPGLLPFEPLVTITFGSSNLQPSAFPITAAPESDFEAVAINGAIEITGGETINITIESIRENAAFR